MTPRTLDALVTLVEIGALPTSADGTTGGPFASAFWPETWKQARTSRRHGLRMRGGVMLSDLVKRGLCERARGDGWNPGYRLSKTGLEAARAEIAKRSKEGGNDGR